MKPFLVHIKSYVQENLDFLRNCSQKNNNSTTHVTFDVKGLYTSIPHNYDLEAISFWTEKHPESLHSRFLKGFVLENTKIILENNNCTFNDEFYTQIIKTAMGTIFAPTGTIYATSRMAYFEVNFYNYLQTQMGKRISRIYFRKSQSLLNDCQTPLDKNKIKLEELLETLYSVNEAIQLTMEFCEDLMSCVC